MMVRRTATCRRVPLPDDYYVLDQNGMRMHGGHNGVSFGVGDKVDVLVVDVTPVNGGILLSMSMAALKVVKCPAEQGGGRQAPGKPPWLAKSL